MSIFWMVSVKIVPELRKIGLGDIALGDLVVYNLYIYKVLIESFFHDLMKIRNDFKQKCAKMNPEGHLVFLKNAFKNQSRFCEKCVFLVKFAKTGAYTR